MNAIKRSTIVAQICLIRDRVRSVQITMKILNVLLFLVIAASTQKLKDNVREAWEKNNEPYVDLCVNETKVDPKIPRIMFRQLHLPDEDTFHCYMRCLFRNLGLLTSEDQINLNALAAAPHISNVLAKDCLELSKPEPNVCKMVYIITVCLTENNYE
ncbi:uncharacterized protein LOC116172325 [Photinus pyralis]|uniref:Uncharacterized protein n=1 Tax=Photinus pyralis TaxID=7054 RepID=A0A1Y1NG30_PHOPY|nr:uncharacterized protein LOC116164859 [Photinus pyralis]XP_031345377.1 uncharacterized protein LOC116172325 [Photinus pyralis]